MQNNKWILSALVTMMALIFLAGGCKPSISIAPFPSSPPNAPPSSSPVTASPSPSPTPTRMRQSSTPYEPVFKTRMYNDLKDVVFQADYIVTGTITEMVEEVTPVVRGTIPGKVYHQIYTLKVDKVIKGNSDIKMLYTNEHPQGDVPEFFDIPSEVLLCLKKEKTGDRYDIINHAPLWERSKRTDSAPDLPIVMGWIVAVMQYYSIPVALSEEDMPPLPTNTQLPPSP